MSMEINADPRHRSLQDKKNALHACSPTIGNGILLLYHYH